MPARLLPSFTLSLCILAALGISSFPRQSDAAATAASPSPNGTDRKDSTDGAAIRIPSAPVHAAQTTGVQASVHASTQGSVTASDGWIRWLPANAPMAAYMQLTNQGNIPVTLLGASSPRFAQVMLHQSVEKGEMSQMHMVATLMLPPHQSVAIAPGGYHLMLMSPPTPIAVGEQVKVTLRFSDGQILDMTLPVSLPTRMH